MCKTWVAHVEGRVPYFHLEGKMPRTIFILAICLIGVLLLDVHPSTSRDASTENQIAGLGLEPKEPSHPVRLVFRARADETVRIEITGSGFRPNALMIPVGTEIIWHNTTGEAQAKTAVLGALNLYLDFVNLFLFLLRFLGERE